MKIFWKNNWKKIVIVLVIAIIIISVVRFFANKNPQTKEKIQTEIKKDEKVSQLIPGSKFKDGVELKDEEKTSKRFPDFYIPTGFKLEGVYDIIEISSKNGITTILFFSPKREKYILKKPDDLIKITKSGKPGQMYVVVTDDPSQNHLFFINNGE